MDYGGYVVIDDIREAKDRGCFNCKNKEQCERFQELNDGARRSRLPWKCWRSEREGRTMIEYHKIETIYQRDMNGSKKLIDGLFRNETVEFLRNVRWTWTEKIDGTNIRVQWDGHKVEFGGRTDKAQIPAHLVNRLNELFGGNEAEQLFEQKFGEKEVIIFGEGYGAKIQSGGDYTEDGKSVDFRAFDILVCGNYLDRENVESIATAFGVNTVPIVGVGTLREAVEFMKRNPRSLLSPFKHEMEGLVCRPSIELQDRCGHRIIVKIKWEDVKDLQGAM